MPASVMRKKADDNMAAARALIEGVMKKAKKEGMTIPSRSGQSEKLLVSRGLMSRDMVEEIRCLSLEEGDEDVEDADDVDISLDEENFW